MEMANIEVNDFGGSPVAEHNMPCAICRKRKAVILLNTGRFHPCHECSKSGWRMLRVPRWLRWLVKSEMD